MEKGKIKEIIYNHRIWINHRQEGKRADFRGEDLSGVDFSRENLYGANFSGANLCKANFYGTVLMTADFSKSDLSNADLRKTFLNKKQILVDRILWELNLMKLMFKMQTWKEQSFQTIFHGKHS